MAVSTGAETGAPTSAPSVGEPAPLRWHHRTLVRSLALAVVAGAVLLVVSLALSPFNNLRLGQGAYLYCALAGLVLLTGASGQVSVGHGALMAVGGYTSALLAVKAGWPLLATLPLAVVAAGVVGIVVGLAAARLDGLYLAGATLALALAVPAFANRFDGLLGGNQGMLTDPVMPPSGLQSLGLERWGAWIACLGALVVTVVIRNALHNGQGRILRAVQDDVAAAALCGVHVRRVKVEAFIVGSATAGLAGALLVVTTSLVSPGAFPLTLSLSLLAGLVAGGSQSLGGAAWGAAVLVLLPVVSDPLSDRLHLSDNLSANLPLAIYGVMLVVIVLAAPRGLHGAAAWCATHLRALATGHRSRTLSGG